MTDGPHIARIAGLIGERTRAAVLSALMADRALTATELAHLTGVTKQTLSVHLAQLVDAGLLNVERQGRHRYHRLAGPEVAQLLESMMGLAFATGAVPLRTGPREPAMRAARVCYDHLAGELAVGAYDHGVANGFLAIDDGAVRLSLAGPDWFARLGLDVNALPRGRRPFCRACLDWSERRHHLAGTLGAALLDRVIQLGWARRETASRVVAFTAVGERNFRSWCEAPAVSP
jgi:DNA-binding transcriptional ArsR family regulator